MVTDIRADTADLDEIRACLANGLPSRVDADEAGIAVLVRGRAGQGFANDIAVRRAIERHAVDSACRHLRTEGWTVDDVGDTESFDLRCTRDGEQLHVEVKGTTSAGASVMVTINEVRHAGPFRGSRCSSSRRLGSNAMLMVDLRAEGGDERLINPWVPAD